MRIVHALCSTSPFCMDVHCGVWMLGVKKYVGWTTTKFGWLDGLRFKVTTFNLKMCIFFWYITYCVHRLLYWIIASCQCGKVPLVKGPLKGPQLTVLSSL